MPVVLVSSFLLHTRRLLSKIPPLRFSLVVALHRVVSLRKHGCEQNKRFHVQPRFRPNLMLSEVCHCVNSVAVCLSTQCTHFFRVLSFIGTAFSFCLFYGHVMLMVKKKKRGGEEEEKGTR